MEKTTMQEGINFKKKRKNFQYSQRNKRKKLEPQNKDSVLFL